MKGMFKRVSLILCFLIISNFILSSLCYAYSPKTIKVTNDEGVQSFIFEGEQLDGGRIYFNVSPSASGIYNFVVLIDGTSAYFEVTDSSCKPLGLASRLNGALSGTASGGSVNVFFENGKTYYLFIHQDRAKYHPIKILVTYVGTDSQVKIWNLPSSVYSAPGISNTNIQGKTIQRAQVVNANDPDRAYTLYSGVPDQGKGLTSIEGQVLPSSINLESGGANVDLPQKIITWLVIYGIADQMDALITMMFGNVTIDSLLFNRYSNTLLDFYSKDETTGQAVSSNDFLNTGLLDVLSDYYKVFRKIAITFYLIILLYIGIRIVLKSTAKDKEKYKSMLMNWLVGVLLLMLFPIAIKYLIIINDTLLRLLDQNLLSQNTELLEKSGLPTGGVVIPPQLSITLKQKDTGGRSRYNA